jgi:hypothetical protein
MAGAELLGDNPEARAVLELARKDLWLLVRSIAIFFGVIFDARGHPDAAGARRWDRGHIYLPDELSLD